MSPESFSALSSWSIWPIIEFTSISIIVVLGYMAMHNMFGHLKPVTKMLLAMLLGTAGYSVAKVFILTVLVGQIIGA